MDIKELKEELLQEARELQKDLVDYNMLALEHLFLDWDDNDYKVYQDTSEEITERLSDISLTLQDVNIYLKKKMV